MRANGFPICPLNNESEWAELDRTGEALGEVVCVCVYVCGWVGLREE